jgi:hypothetical protein
MGYGEPRSNWDALYKFARSDPKDQQIKGQRSGDYYEGYNDYLYQLRPSRGRRSAGDRQMLRIPVEAIAEVAADDVHHGWCKLKVLRISTTASNIATVVIVEAFRNLNKIHG